MHRLQPTNVRTSGSLTRAASPLQARLGRKLAIAGGLALMALLATAGAVAASDPIGTVDEPALPEPSEPIVSVEVTEPTEPSVSVEVTEPTEPSVSVEVSEPSEASLSVEVAPTPEVNVSAEPPAPAPVPGGDPVGPVPPPEALIAPVTELVADLSPTDVLPDADELVALPPLEPPSLPGTDAITPKLLDAIEDARGAVSSSAVPTAADRLPSDARSVAIDGWSVVVVAGDPAQRDSGPGTSINPAGIIGLSGADDGLNRGGVRAPGVVPPVAPLSSGTSGNSITDLYPFAAVLATLAAGGAGGWILSLRAPPNPSGIWVAAPVPPG
jgi:hypothetical protein